MEHGRAVPNPRGRAAGWSATNNDAALEEATVDCYGDSRQVAGMDGRVSQAGMISSCS